jgi:Animal haem peroxidase
MMPSSRQIVWISGLFIILMGTAYWGAGVEAQKARRQIEAQLSVVQTAAKAAGAELNKPKANQPEIGRLSPKFICPSTKREFDALDPPNQVLCKLKSLQSLGNPWKGTSDHTNVNYWRTINSIAVCLLLLGPAFSLFVLRRPGGPGGEWVMFWTAAYLAFVAHLGTGLLGLFGGHFEWVFKDVVAPPRVTHPYGDTLTSVWWTADVVLAWTGSRLVWVQFERGLLHAVLFVSAVMSSIILSSNWYVLVLGVLLILVVLSSAAYRIVVYPFDPTSVSGRVYRWFFEGINRFVPWYALSTWGAVFNLGALRIVLRAKNLHNTSDIPVSNAAGLQPAIPFEARFLTERHPDGFHNDLTKPWMGSTSLPPPGSHDSIFFTKSNPGARFGRNIPLDEAFPEAGPGLLQPSPRLISNELLARKNFLPAKTLNFLAAAWIQFETHDWFQHGEPVETDPFNIPLQPNDPWPQEHNGCPMHIRRTRPDPTRDYDLEIRQNNGLLKYPPTYVNAETHWWDASQIYGSNWETTLLLRSEYRSVNGKPVPTGNLVAGGKLYLDENKLRLDPTTLGDALVGFAGNWWAGLSLLHTLFAREHNAICDRLRSAYPAWDDERLFHTARLINAALMAKIHTVEWTPAILAHPALEIGMNANWWGLETERVYRSIGRISENEAFAGMPLSGVDHTGADYCLTEEFVSVYRMHPLMRDDLEVRSAQDGRLLRKFEMMEGVVGTLEDLKVFSGPWGMGDVFYSFGTCNPGAITVHNFPNFLRNFRRPDGEYLDLASVDIMRDRERGAPRYNRFLQFLHKKPIRSFDELENPLHPGLPTELRAIYGHTQGNDHVDRLDLMVGLYWETPPVGFGFSDTAFRIFILMASRRLKSDRFIAKDFTPELYTREGIEWVDDNSMITVLLRHFPELADALRDVTNAFKPWNDLNAPVSSEAAPWQRYGR